MGIKVEFVLLIVFSVVFQWFVVQSLETCPKVETIKDLNLTSFAGRWYDIKNYSTLPFIYPGKCYSTEFVINSPDTITIIISHMVKNKPTTASHSATKDESGVFTAKMEHENSENFHSASCVLKNFFLSNINHEISHRGHRLSKLFNNLTLWRNPLVWSLSCYLGVWTQEDFVPNPSRYVDCCLGSSKVNLRQVYRH